MAKWTRMTVGSICKGMDGKPDYMVLNKFHKTALINALRDSGEKGLFLNLESKKGKLEGLKEAVKIGKLSEDGAAKAIEYAENIPDWIRFEIVLATKE